MKEADAQRRQVQPGLERGCPPDQERGSSGARELRLQALVEQAAEALIALDAEGRIQGVNSAAARMFDYDRAQLIGRHFGLLVPSVARGGMLSQLRARAARAGDGDCITEETEGRLVDGFLFPITLSVKSLWVDGEISFAVRISDNSERTISMQALRDSEGRSRALVEQAPEAIVVYDEAEDRIVDVNENAQRLFGRSRCELLQSGIASLSPALQPDGRPSTELLSAFNARALAGETPVFEWVHEDAQGRQIPCEVRLLRFPSTHQNLIRGSITDISERKRAARALRDSERRFRAIFENTFELMGLLSPDGVVLEANQAALRFSGLQLADVVGRPIWDADWWGSRHRGVVRRRLRTAVRQAARGDFVRCEMELCAGDGKSRTLDLSVKPLLGEQGEVLMLIPEARDISERKRAENAVVREKERAQVTLDSIGDAVVTTDARGRIDYLNPVAEQLCGRDQHAALGRKVSEVMLLLAEETQAPVEHPVLRCLRDGRTRQHGEPLLLLSHEGQRHLTQYSASTIRGRDGSVLGAVMVFRELDAARHLHMRLSYHASHDSLTGLLNRSGFERRLNAALATVRADERLRHTLLYIDVDQFKVVNDTCGHIAGDQLLRQVTGVLRGGIRANDILARLGGDEFCVLLEGCALHRAVEVAEKIRLAVNQERFAWEDLAFNVTVSVGAVELCKDSESSAAVLSAADVACYAAKDSGRNRTHVYRRKKVSKRHREMHWVARVTSAWEENRLTIYHQPIVAIQPAAGPARYTELLLRMRDRDGSIVTPGDFIPAAERYNLMPEIDRWVVTHALENLAHRRSDHEREPYTLAINLSGTSLSDHRFLDFIGEALVAHNVSAAAVCFEITETAAISNLAKTARFMRELKKLGCQFSLDDFGRGFSSFAYLKSLPVDFIKIDGHFVKQIAEDSIDSCIVDAIRQVGHAMGIKTIAEKVEEQGVLTRLAELGIDYAQGHHVAVPLPAEDRDTFSDTFESSDPSQRRAVVRHLKLI